MADHNNIDNGLSDKKQLLFLFSSSPYHSSQAQEGIETALAAAAFEYRIKIIFIGEGLRQLWPQQRWAKQANTLQRKNISALLNSLPLYDIEQVFFVAGNTDDSAPFKTNNDSTLDIIEIHTDKLTTFINESDIVLRY